MRHCTLLRSLARLFALGAVSGSVAVGAPSRERIEELFRPWLAERVAMSPDGRYVAYTRQAGDDLTIDILDVEQGRRMTTLVVDEARTVLHSKEKEPARLRFLQWATATRLVFAPEVHVIAPPVRLLPAVPGEARPPPLEPTVFAPVMAVDADGKNPRTLLDADTFAADVGSLAQTRLRMRAPTILGLMPDDRQQLLVQIPEILSRTTPAPAEVVRVDVTTGKREPMISESNQGGIALRDRQGNARLLMERTRSLRRTYLFQPAGSRRWRPLHEAKGPEVLPRFTMTPENYFGERAVPLGFDYHGEVLIYGANIGRDTFGVYGLNLATLQPTDLMVEHPERDFAPLAMGGAADALVFDPWRQRLAGVRAQGAPPFTVWVDAELAQVQWRLAERFPQRSVTIEDWDAKRQRFLLRVTGGSEPGRYFVWQRREDLMVEILRRAPWLPNTELHETRYFEATGEDGALLGVHLTVPRSPRLNPPPLAICFAGGFPPAPHAEFDPEAQVLADMGFVVARLNQRGVLGHGAKRRDAARGQIDRAAARDAVAAIAAVAARQPIDRRRVVTFGAGFAGYLALRAAQLEPEAFRCAVGIEPVLSLAAWVQPPADFDAPQPTLQQEIDRKYLEQGKTKVHDLSVMAQPEALGAAVFIAYRGHRADAIARDVAHLRGQLKRRGVPHDVVDVGDDFALRLPAARWRAYRALEEFFNLNLYNPNVKIGPTRVVK